MTQLSETQVELLHEHYRDTCGVMQSQRASRDRHFYLVIAVLGLAMFDVATPQGFAAVIGEVLKSQFNLASSPDLAYVRSILWFLLLGLTVRYSQVTLNLERQFDYIHELEVVLQQHVHEVFRREGSAYLERYPRFLDWAHFLYTIVFPLLLCVVAIAWTYRQVPSGSWPVTAWFNLTVTILLLISVALYLETLHRRRIDSGVARWRAWWSARGPRSKHKRVRTDE